MPMGMNLVSASDDQLRNCVPHAYGDEPHSNISVAINDCVPHAYGDEPVERTTQIGAQVCSPCLWGLTGSYLQRGAVTAVFPMPMGMNRTPFHFELPILSVPHAYGDEPATIA